MDGLACPVSSVDTPRAALQTLFIQGHNTYSLASRSFLHLLGALHIVVPVYDHRTGYLLECLATRIRKDSLDRVGNGSKQGHRLNYHSDS